jgi:hypothetical protein
MKHSISSDDQDFKERVEACNIPVAEFGHRAHLRLAYIYLIENSTDSSINLVRETLTGLLRHNNIEPSAKYHETLTKAWLLVVNHFMNNTDATGSADEFINENPELLDSKIMLTHYSAERLFSEEARRAFVEPDLEPKSS